MTRDVQAEIKKIVEENPIVLFMKGTPMMPMCGFSGNSVEILRACGVNQFKAVDVLSDEAIRQGIKVYSNWPTIPQLYINGEFVGGNDIMREMYQEQELQQKLQQANA